MYDSCMQTINISLPPKLHADANKLVQSGDYASFSDVVRTALRDLVRKSPYDTLVEKALLEEKKGIIKSLKTKKDISNFLAQL